MYTWTQTMVHLDVCTIIIMAWWATQLAFGYVSPLWHNPKSNAQWRHKNCTPLSFYIPTFSHSSVLRFKMSYVFVPLGHRGGSKGKGGENTLVYPLYYKIHNQNLSKLLMMSWMDIGGVWLGCVHWMFVFRRLRVTSFNSIPGLLRETRSLLVKQR